MSTLVRPGFVVWLTGLPSSGKTTLAHALGRLLAERGIDAALLDSDELRRRLTPNPTYSDGERDGFYRTLAILAELLAAHGVNVLIAATAPKREHRQAARDRISRFAEVHVDCPPEVCRARDPKGLWRRADRGEINTLPGAGAPYEAPEAPEVRIDTSCRPVDAAAREILAQLDAQGFWA